MRSCELRLLKQLGDTDVWKHTGRIHAWIYRKTNGAIGHAAGRLTNLLLTTTGRRSGAARTVALCYIVDGANYVLFGSNGGRDRHPAWWLNLQATDPKLAG